MRFEPTAIDGVYVVDIEPSRDERGLFARLNCESAFEQAGIAFRAVQTSLSRNTARHTLRGMHFQTGEAGEAKLVRVVRGAVFDVVLDLRAGAGPADWIGVELTAENARALYIPHGCAHGFLTLTADADLLYQMDSPHDPTRAAGLSWNDPAFAIAWPSPPEVISARDQSWPAFSFAQGDRN